MNKISKTARLLDRVIAVVYWLLIIAVPVMLATFIPAIRAMTQQSDRSLARLSLGDVEFLLAPGILHQITTGESHIAYISALVASLISVPVFILLLRTIRSALRPFIDRTPFHDTVAKNLKKLAVLVVIYFFMDVLMTVFMDLLYSTRFNLNSLFISDQILGVSYSPTVDTMPLFFAGVLYLLSKVFLYGQELQTLSDETL